MRKIFTLLFLFFSAYVSAQELTGTQVQLNDTIGGCPRNVQIKIRCGRSNVVNNNQPLMVVDGEIRALGTLNQINPNHIERLDVLKGAAATALFGNQGMNGVILVSLKKIKLVILDKADSAAIAGATIKAEGNKLGACTNEKGIALLTRGLFTDKKLNISSVGYEGKSALTVDDSLVIYLERHFEIAEPVYITCQPIKRTGCPRGYSITRPAVEQVNEVEPEIPVLNVKVYPCPVVRGQIVRAEFFSENVADCFLRIIALDGKIYVNNKISVVRGQNRFEIETDARWSGGIYFMQIIRSGHPILQQKLLVD